MLILDKRAELYKSMSIFYLFTEMLLLGSSLKLSHLFTYNLVLSLPIVTYLLTSYSIFVDLPLLVTWISELFFFIFFACWCLSYFYTKFTYKIWGYRHNFWILAKLFFGCLKGLSSILLLKLSFLFLDLTLLSFLMFFWIDELFRSLYDILFGFVNEFFFFSKFRSYCIELRN